MYGLVNKGLQELLIARFGEATWEKIKAHAKIEEELFISNESYPDSLTYSLVSSACAVTFIRADELLFAFGEYWVMQTGRISYGALFDAAGKTLPEFLNNLPNFHTRVKMMFPKLEPPKFKIANQTPSSLELHYVTHRPGLTDFVRGLISGLGRSFRTEVRSSLISSKSSGAEHDVFLIEWTPQ
jgi:hypothetical protein